MERSNVELGARLAIVGTGNVAINIARWAVEQESETSHPRTARTITATARARNPLHRWVVDRIALQHEMERIGAERGHRHSAEAAYHELTSGLATPESHIAQALYVSGLQPKPLRSESRKAHRPTDHGYVALRDLRNCSRRPNRESTIVECDSLVLPLATSGLHSEMTTPSSGNTPFPAPYTHWLRRMGAHRQSR